jgi:hypothetical protein
MEKKTKKTQKQKDKSNEWYRKECVKVAKKIVHIRDNDICQKCGKPGNALHCSHVYPEGTYHGMSANPLNMKLLCYYCHFFWWHKNPLEAKDWFVKTFPDRYKKLKKLSQQTLQHNYKKMLIELKEQLKEL